MLAVSTIQGLRGDVMLGRDDVASIIDNNGRVAVAVGGEGGFGDTRLRNKREGTALRTMANGRSSEYKGNEETKHVGRAERLGDVQGRMPLPLKDATPLYLFASRKESRGKHMSSILFTTANAETNIIPALSAFTESMGRIRRRSEQAQRQRLT